MELGASGRSPREPRHKRARQVTFAARQGTKMQIGALAMQAIGFTNITDNLKNGKMLLSLRITRRPKRIIN